MAFPTGQSNGATTTLNGVTYVYNSTDGSWSPLTLNNANASVFLNTGGTITGNLAVTGSLSVGSFAQTSATFTNSTGPQLSLSGGTSNWINFGTGGVAPPSFTTRSVGSKIVLYEDIGATAAGYAIGIDNSTLWYGTDTTSAQHKWYAGTTNTMTLSGAGVLTVTGPIFSNSYIDGQTPNSGSTGGIRVRGISGGLAYLQFVDTTASSQWGVVSVNSSGNWIWNGTQQVTSLGIGTAASATTGQILATNSITAYYSDRRLKTVKHTINNALAKVDKLSGVIYTQNTLAETFGYNDYNDQVGVIAQEVQAVLPEAVKIAPFDMAEDGSSKSGENYLTVQYEKIVPLLIEAIKELNQTVVSLQQEVKELKGK